MIKYKIQLSKEQLELISTICHDYKDSNRGNRLLILPVMRLEKSLSKQTSRDYKADTAYDVSAKNSLSHLRSSVFDKIKSLMNYNQCEVLDSVDIEEGSSPVVLEDPFDDNNTYTLDRISLDEKGNLSFDASSCAGNITLNEETLSTDALLSIVDWLDINLDHE